MKKKYQSPKMKVVNIQSSKLLVGSVHGFNNKISTSGMNGIKALSRGGSLDEEDVEDLERMTAY
jgi:hypothetical protein